MLKSIAAFIVFGFLIRSLNFMGSGALKQESDGGRSASYVPVLDEQGSPF